MKIRLLIVLILALLIACAIAVHNCMPLLTLA